jgi:hypothetical protein
MGALAGVFHIQAREHAMGGGHCSVMNVEKLSSKLPLITGWIDEMLAKHAADAQLVTDFRFARLPLYFSAHLLACTKVVTLGRVPVPPLTAMGLPEFAAFENGNYRGITYKDTYFLQILQAANESTHFHELVHVVQWAHLGVERFLLAYAAGLAANGYEKNPMEVMASALQAYFERKGQPVDVETVVRNTLREQNP